MQGGTASRYPFPNGWQLLFWNFQWILLWITMYFSINTHWSPWYFQIAFSCFETVSCTPGWLWISYVAKADCEYQNLLPPSTQKGTTIGCYGNLIKKRKSVWRHTEGRQKMTEWCLYKPRNIMDCQKNLETMNISPHNCKRQRGGPGIPCFRFLTSVKLIENNFLLFYNSHLLVVCLRSTRKWI